MCRTECELGFICWLVTTLDLRRLVMSHSGSLPEASDKYLADNTACMAAHFTPVEDGGVLCGCDGRQLPHACGALSHCQAGGLGQAGRAGQTRRQPPAAGLTPEALPASARAATWGILATCHARAGVPTASSSGCAAGRCCAACQAGCMCKHQVW